jgi:hypothetical protein
LFGGLNVKSNSLVVTSAGYVGLGTTSPIVPLSVAGSAGVRVEGSNTSSVALQVLSNLGYLNGILLHVDTGNASNSYTARVGIGTTDPQEALHIKGGSLKLERYSPAHGDLNIPNGSLHLPYMSHDSPNRMGGPRYFCMKIGTGITGKAVGSYCGSYGCGGTSPQPACNASNCGTGGWCSNQGLHNHYIVASSVDVYLPAVRDRLDDGRMYWIIFQRNGTDTSRSIIGPGTGVVSSNLYNPAAQNFVTLDGQNFPLANIDIPYTVSGVTYAQRHVNCVFSGSMWHCFTWNGNITV